MRTFVTASLTLLVLLISSLSTSAVVAAVTRSENFKMRLCDRVERRFADRPQIMERINERVQRRFGFSCEEPPEEMEEEVMEEQVESNDYFDVSSVVPLSSTALEITFPVNMNADAINDPKYYTVRKTGLNGEVQGTATIGSIDVLDAKTVELHFTKSQLSCTENVLRINDMPTDREGTLSAEMRYINYRATVQTDPIFELENNSSTETKSISKSTPDVKLFSLNYENSCTDIAKMKSMHLTLIASGSLMTKTGTGSVHDLENIYVKMFGSKTVPGNLVRTPNSYTLIFERPISFNTCSSDVMDIYANFTPNAKEDIDYQFSIESVNDIVMEGSSYGMCEQKTEIIGTFPMHGTVIDVK